MPLKNPSEAELKKEQEILTDIEKLKKSSEKLKKILELIDKYVFLKNSLPIKLMDKIKSRYEKHIPSAAYYFDKDQKGRTVNESYLVNKKINDKKNDYLIAVTIHEVRHRVQHKFPIELFNKNSWGEIERQYPTLKLLKKRLPKNLSPNDFDASVVENLSSFLRKNGISLIEISTDIIPKSPKEILENIEILARNKKFIIPKY